jgi:hypothetical protein
MNPFPEPPSEPPSEPASPEPPTTHLPSENEVTRQLLRWAIDRGWRCHRNHVGVYYTRDGRPQRINDPGMPDWLFLHPEHPPVWVEVKRPRERPRKIQREYMAVLQHRGFRVCWVSSVEELERKFAEWGLPS